LELSYHATVNDRDTNFPQVMAMCEEMIGVWEELASIKRKAMEDHGTSYLRPNFSFPSALLVALSFLNALSPTLKSFLHSSVIVLNSSSKSLIFYYCIELTYTKSKFPSICISREV
jgi:hypothetical protein